MSLFVKEKLIDILSCPCCFARMQPPACLCSNGHLICRKCWDNIDRCPQCNAFYRVPIDSDGIKKRMKCTLEHAEEPDDRNCAEDDLLECNYVDEHLVLCDGNPSTAACYYNRDQKWYPVGGVLIGEVEYKRRCALVVPVTCSTLDELMKMGLSLMEDGVNGTSVRSDHHNHEMECIWRRVNRPEPHCDWIGPVHTFSAHILDAAVNSSAVDHGTFVQIDDDQIGTINLKLPLETDGQPKLFFLATKAAGLVLKLSEKERLTMTVQHFGLRKESDKFVFKLRIQSIVNELKELKYQLDVNNDSDELCELAEAVLPPMAMLTKGGYINKQGMLKMNVLIQEIEGAGMVAK